METCLVLATDIKLEAESERERERESEMRPNGQHLPRLDVVERKSNEDKLLQLYVAALSGSVPTLSTLIWNDPLICRAMSQLEVGNRAVASFGKKGNIRLLHDFDQPFTGESGVKMISSLTFKQENTITDEPVLDLLMFLKKKLDAAVANARTSFWTKPFTPGDGRLHEKEKLKRCVRDVLSSKRMVAFLILDSLQESIMDLQEVVSIQDKNNPLPISFSKYLDSFPFPYYVVLRNIEALPNTLADLLRQVTIAQVGQKLGALCCQAFLNAKVVKNSKHCFH